jgi:rhodanese-related sulfurtransferase/DNA-binding transcriptional ArsR family regulator
MRSDAREFKDAIYEQFGRIGKAVASPRRIELLDLLCQGPRTVDVLSRQAGQSLANTSHHLQVLRSARLVEAVRNGSFVTYRLADADVSAFFAALRGLAESHLAEVPHVAREFLESRGAVEAIGVDALVERIRRGEVTVIDVRPHDEYLAGHIPGAVSVPIDELKERLDEWPLEEQIVAYCRGRYCVLAIEAVETLTAEGFDATRLELGVLDWQAAGYGVEVGSGI